VSPKHLRTVYLRQAGNLRKRQKSGAVRCEVCDHEPDLHDLCLLHYAQERDNQMITVCPTCAQMALVAASDDETAQGDTNFEM